MDLCWLRGATGDALRAVLCAAGYNIRWVLRAIVRLGLKGHFAPLYSLLAALVAALEAAGSNKGWGGSLGFGGRVNFAGPIRYGSKVIDLAKGKNAVELSSNDELTNVLLNLQEAVMDGSLDGQIELAADAVSARLIERK